MYPHFIEVHDGDQTMIVNIDKIGIVKDKLIMVEHPKRWQPVDESYEQLQKLIQNSGCLINKGDPRLDNKPLTMDDLVRMVGEPVWNSSLRRWHLVEETEPDKYRGAVVTLKGTQHSVWYYDSADLIRHPLYRKKPIDEGGEND